MVVVVIIGVLAGILLPVLSKARDSAKVKWAQKELAELGAVIALYHRDQIIYPPDTGDWAAAGGNPEDPADIDDRSIHRYLGQEVVNWKGETYSAYMSMDWKRVEDTDNDPASEDAGFFLDPFGEPYQLDVMHMTPPPAGNPGAGYTQKGWPYILETSGDPTRRERLLMVRDFKFVSYGADTRSVAFPFDMGELNTPDPVRIRPGFAADDICSW